MMDPSQYAEQRDMSYGLFRNALVVPVAAAVLATADIGETFAVTDLREQLGGRTASNQIQDVLEARLEKCGAVEQLPYLGQPRPRIWERRESPFWSFIESWAQLKA